MEVVSEKHSIRSLLFTRAIPNYVIPVPLNGHKVHTCTDCGDKFIFESSYNDHVNRKSVKISYMCRHCGQLAEFKNRCNLLCHIRSHIFKTTTINVSDLKIEPLPLSEFRKINDVAPASEVAKKISSVFCFECKTVVPGKGPAYKDRASHLMKFTNEVHSCPVCLFALPTICALKVHLRLHLRIPPFYCPECGIRMNGKNLNYPYSHDCEGFRMMRATARTRCVIDGCPVIHPSDFKEHMKQYHLKKVFKCPFCVVACFNEKTMQKHSLNHNFEVENTPLIFYQCEACPGRFVMQNHMEQHLKNHTFAPVFPCWACSTYSKDVTSLIKHYRKNHCNDNAVLKDAINEVLKHSESLKTNSKSKRLYRVVKCCGQCKRNFIYQCTEDEILDLPIKCPYNCTTPLQSIETKATSSEVNTQITCHLCQNQISQDWEEIKKHYALNHKAFRCLDAKIRVDKMDITKLLPQIKNKITSGVGNIVTITKNKRAKRRQPKKPSTPAPEAEVILVTPTITASDISCSICGKDFEDKQVLEKHMVTHRDPCMAYQCMECGQSFVVKPSFSKHLLLEHSICDVDEYINSKQCYNENALLKYQDSAVISNEPLAENQCRICREQYDNPTDLEKHFRVHGMAFLKTRRNT